MNIDAIKHEFGLKTLDTHQQSSEWAIAENPDYLS